MAEKVDLRFYLCISFGSDEDKPHPDFPVVETKVGILIVLAGQGVTLHVELSAVIPMGFQVQQEEKEKRGHQRYRRRQTTRFQPSKLRTLKGRKRD